MNTLRPILPRNYFSPKNVFVMGKKRLECAVCHKMCVSNSALLCHIRSHTGEKPYKCVICHKMFNKASHLKIHKMRHTGEKPYECEFCLKRFKLTRSLNKHMKSFHIFEKRYEQKIDNKALGQPYLNGNMKVLSDYKQYKCEICQKTFLCLYNFSIHIGLPMGENLCKCEFCSKGFTHSSNLNKYKKLGTVKKSSCTCNLL